MDPPAPIEKRQMDASSTYRSYILEKRHSMQDCVSWKIERFDKMKDNISYISKCDPQGWILSLTKRKKSLIIAIKTQLSNQNVECRVVGEKSSTQRGQAEECGEGTYQAKFQAYGGRDNFMENTGIEVIFMIVKLSVRRYFPMVSFGRNVYDESDFYESMHRIFSHLVKSCSHEDFVLRGKNYAIPVHKPLLAVRSTFFSKYFTANPDEEELKMCFSFAEIIMVLSFMYTGEVRMHGNLDFILEVFKAAIVLGVTGLQAILTFHFRQIMDLQNVRVFEKLATRVGAESLKKAVKEFIENNGLSGHFEKGI